MGINGMKENIYNLPSTTASWAYCYVISVLPNSEECLYDVTLTDPAPIGGITGVKNITKVDETLCQGQTVYIPGVTRTGLTGQ